MKFYICAEILDAKLLVLRFRRLSEQTRMQKYIYGNFANFNPWAIVNTSCKKSFAHAIIDALTLRSLFVIRAFSVSVVALVHALFINAYWRAEPVPRDLKLNKPR